MNTSLRLILVASLYASMTGCAIIAAAGLNVAAQGVLALALTPVVHSGQAGTDRCVESVGENIQVTDLSETATPTHEGTFQTFERAYWRFEYEGEDRELENPRVATEGSLIITERSVRFVPSAGTTGVRIPYEVVRNVEFDRNSPKPYFVSIRSLCDRSDIFRFMKKDDSFSLDPDATASATAQIKARVAAVQANANKDGETPH